ncbi:MAG TPA: nitroreductase/quinone reductase family protein [Dehalococcoidia bacterium]|nr:nitroreductase/quinone reductase family protein [Dehalococcoidia bacterium]
MKRGTRVLYRGDSTREDREGGHLSLYSALNRLVEPGVRAGLGSLWLLPVGLIVLETTGRKTGQTHRVPLLAAMVAGHVVVSTVRVGQSQWLQNVLQNPDVRYWLRGQELRGEAIVVMSGRDVPEVLDDDARCLVEALRPAAALGAAFVILLHRRHGQNEKLIPERPPDRLRDRIIMRRVGLRGGLRT